MKTFDEWYDSDEIDDEIEGHFNNELYNRINERSYEDCHTVFSNSFCEDNTDKQKRDDTNNSFLSYVQECNQNESVIDLIDSDKSESIIIIDDKDQNENIFYGNGNSNSETESDKSVKIIRSKYATNYESDSGKSEIVDETEKGKVNLANISEANKVIELMTGNSTMSCDENKEISNEVILNINSSKFTKEKKNYIELLESSDESNSEKSDDLHETLFFKKNNDPNWAVNDADLLPISKFSNRYFDMNANENCGICRKKGHSENQCTRNSPVCALCGVEGHLYRRCPNDLCMICFDNSHNTKKCPNKKKFLRTVCQRCNQLGHPNKCCPDIWRQYKYTLESSVPPEVKKFRIENRRSVYCANCAKTGHFTDECKQNNMHSNFIGPAPIKDIIDFNSADVYKKPLFKYTNTCANNDLNIVKVVSDLEGDQKSFKPILCDLDVTGLIEDNHSCDQFDIQMETDNTTASSKSVTPTPNDNVRYLIDKVESLPPINKQLLCKLFPDETKQYSIIPASLRKKLRLRLKQFLKNGYLPPDSEATQQRMEEWLEEITDGQRTSFKTKKNLLSSVSAAVHSISNRVIDERNSKEASVQNRNESGKLKINQNDIKKLQCEKEEREKLLNSIRLNNSVEIVTEPVLSNKKMKTKFRRNKSTKVMTRSQKKDAINI